MPEIPTFPAAPVPQEKMSQSQQDAVKCPTCKKDKEWKGDKPAASMKGVTGAKGMRFRPMSVKKPPGPQRKKPLDKRYVKFY